MEWPLQQNICLRLIKASGTETNTYNHIMRNGNFQLPVAYMRQQFFFYFQVSVLTVSFFGERLEWRGIKV